MAALSLKRRISNGLRRLRHFRGHGVHSPYVYSIVREVFMRRGLSVDRCEGLLVELQQLVARRLLSKRDAEHLHNIYIHCGYSSYAIDPQCVDGVDFVVATSCFERYITESRERGTTVVLILKCGSIATEEITLHPSTVVERRGYTIFFNNHLPHQHFIL